MTDVLQLVDVVKRHGSGASEVMALDHVTIGLRSGEFVAVMGPSGSGKTSLVLVAAGLDQPDVGHVVVDGTVVDGRDRGTWARLRRERIGVVFQQLSLIPTMTAIENVMVPLELDGVGRRAARAAAVEALGDCGVAHLAERHPDDLSGGQQQQVAIARALVGGRGILLADEPTGALDSQAQEQIVELLGERAADGAAVLMVTHDSGLAAWADRVVFLRDGAVVPGEAVLGRGAAVGATVVGAGAMPATGSQR